eukprot:TRINITY_DN1681_c4_g1_i1.p1 TRINITY_DN1681_c4_g1~~TRINITY_DN1681_c4_g1_i1.p1  ORF type:complete len:513 (-),score=206.36 TRINITY_DN1681_c4_g1_i1:206-1744(-)
MADWEDDEEFYDYGTPGGKKKDKCDMFRLETNKSAVTWYAVFLCFLASSGYTITLPSLYLFLKDLGVCGDATPIWNGVAIGIYCLGQVISANVLGVTANKVNLSICFGVSLFFDFLGNSMYGLSFSKWILLPGRFIAGIGAGNVAIARAYVASVYPASERTAAMSKLSTAQATGFIYGPAIGAAVSLIPPYKISNYLHFNQFTTPAFLAAGLGIVAITILLLCFRNLPRLSVADNKSNDDDTKTPFVDDSNELTEAAQFDEEPKGFWESLENKRGIIVSLIIFFTVTQVFVLFETTLTPATEEYFGWTSTIEDTDTYPNACTGESDQVDTEGEDKLGVLYNGLLFVACGIVAFVMLFSVSKFNKVKISNVRSIDRLMLVVGWGIMLFACLIIFTWSENPHGVAYMIRYIIGILFLVAGYCVGQVETLSIYSKMLGSNRPGLLMGFITSAGSIARVTGPVLAGILFSIGGIDFAISITFDMLAVAFAVILIFWKSLLPVGGENTGVVIDAGGH